MIMPVGADNFTHAVQMGSETYHVLKKIISKEYGTTGTGVGDEGGFAPDIDTESEALDLLVKAIKEAGYEGKMKIALDPASSEFWRAEHKHYDLSFKSKTKRHLSTAAMIDLYGELISKYPIASIEDGL
jgi:enolase